VYLRFLFSREGSSTTVPGLGTVVDLPIVNPSAVTTTRNSEKSYALTYMGTIDIPPAVAAGSGLRGILLDNETRFRFQLRNAARAAATAMTFRVLDVILMKYDEAFAMIEMQANPTESFPVEEHNNTQHVGVYDNTGYLNHGKTDAVAFGSRRLGESFLELRGQELFLEPNKRNRLYFLNDEYVRLSASTYEVISDYQTASSSLDNRDMGVQVYVVPRWVGARDD
jgi:hypothetical protein